MGCVHALRHQEPLTLLSRSAEPKAQPTSRGLSYPGQQGAAHLREGLSTIMHEVGTGELSQKPKFLNLSRNSNRE